MLSREGDGEHDEAWCAHRSAKSGYELNGRVFAGERNNGTCAEVGDDTWRQCLLVFSTVTLAVVCARLQACR